jgi:hypothetical protein
MIGATDQRTTSGPVDTILHAKEAEDMTAPTISATPKKPLISGRHPDMAALGYLTRSEGGWRMTAVCAKADLAGC